jgi:transcriptional regulator with XRE-family HTH domain
MQQPAIARIERGHGNPSLRTLLAMAKALDADLVLKYKH